MPSLHPASNRREKLRLATLDGYLPRDWQQVGRAQLLALADHARILADRYANMRDFYNTQAEYLDEAAMYDGGHIDI